MKKITLLWFGKTQDKHISELIDFYKKRLKPLLDLEIKELKEPKVVEKESKLKEELKTIEQNIPKSSKVIILDEKGPLFSSPKFSENLESYYTQGFNNICFVIGSAYGFHKDIYAKGYTLLSLSKMTFTHDMVRMFLLEQLYRAEMITRNTGYHH